MIISQGQVGQLRQMLVDVEKDKVSSDEVNWDNQIYKIKLIARAIKSAMPKYYEFQIDNMFIEGQPDYKNAFIQEPAMNEVELNNRMSKLLGRISCVMEFLSTHATNVAIDEKDAESMKNNFRFVKTTIDNKATLDCVREMLDLMSEIYIIERHVERDFQVTM